MGKAMFTTLEETKKHLNIDEYFDLLLSEKYLDFEARFLILLKLFRYNSFVDTF